MTTIVILLHGQFFSGTSYRIYLLGNPIIWWSNLIFLVAFLVVVFVTAIKQRRLYGQQMLHRHLTTQQGFMQLNGTNNNEDSDETQRLSLRAAIWFFIGWILHYLPFWTMGRVLYFHHYFPALIFNSMLAGVMFNYLSSYLPKWIQHILFGGLISVLLYSFIQFSPLAYGMKGPLSNDPISTMHGLKWLSSWEF